MGGGVLFFFWKGVYNFEYIVKSKWYVEIKVRCRDPEKQRKEEKKEKKIRGDERKLPLNQGRV